MRLIAHRDVSGVGTNHPDRNLLRTLHRMDWVVYAKAPFGGPQHVLHYLARYTHRLAISNHRIVDITDNKACPLGSLNS